MHKTLYDELVGLLGKSHTNKDFKSFLASKREPVQVVKDSKVTPYRSASSKISHYFFPHFSLVIKDSMVSEVYAFINQPTKTTDAHFSGLPAGIISGDKRLDVQRKLGIKPAHSKIISRTGYTIDRYRLPPIVLSFWFAPDSQLMTEFRMKLTEMSEAEA
jgi:hypothetical protein